MHAARSQRLTLPSIRSQHNHWAIPDTVTPEYAACGATSHCFKSAIQLATVSG